MKMKDAYILLPIVIRESQTPVGLYDVYCHLVQRYSVKYAVETKNSFIDLQINALRILLIKEVVYLFLK